MTSMPPRSTSPQARVSRVLSHLVVGATASSSSAAPTSAARASSGLRDFGGMLAARALLEQNTSVVFTLTGGHVSPILVGCNQVGIRVVDVRDEATTVFAADATSRITGQVGVAIVTAGPGLTNTITPVKNAQLAEVPVVIFGGATAQILKGRGALQDIDQHALMGPHVKWSTTVRRVKQIIPTIRKAFRIAQEGVPGPVFVEFPLETLWPPAFVRGELGAAEAPSLSLSLLSNPAKLMATLGELYIHKRTDYIFAQAFDDPGPNTEVAPYPARPTALQLTKAVQLFRKASRPLIVVGSQAVVRPESAPELFRALEALGAPVYVSGMARGLMGKEHRLWMRHKRKKALQRADLVLLLGGTPDFRLNYGRDVAKGATFALVNLNKSSLSLNWDLRRHDATFQVDPCTFLVDVQQRVGHLGGPTLERWVAELQDNQAAREAEIDAMAAQAGVEAAAAVEAGGGPPFVDPVRCFRILDEYLDEKSTLVADGGDFVGTASYILRPRVPLAWLDPGVFGTLGVGAGFTLAAAAAGRQPWLIWGDGSCGWGLMEVDTAVRHKLAFVAVIGNDASWRQMERDQVRVLGDATATQLVRSDYHRAAEALGAKGIVVRTESELRPALELARRVAFGPFPEGQTHGLPVVVNVMIRKSAFREGSISV